MPTRFKLRVLEEKLGKRYTGRKLFPMISAKLAPAPADGDCDATPGQRVVSTTTTISCSTR